MDVQQAQPGVPVQYQQAPPPQYGTPLDGGQQVVMAAEPQPEMYQQVQQVAQPQQYYEQQTYMEPVQQPQMQPQQYYEQPMYASPSQAGGQGAPPVITTVQVQGDVMQPPISNAPQAVAIQNPQVGAPPAQQQAPNPYQYRPVYPEMYPLYDPTRVPTYVAPPIVKKSSQREAMNVNREVTPVARKKNRGCC